MKKSSTRSGVFFDRFLPIIIVLLVLVSWEGLARAGYISAFFFPPPSTILQTLLTLFTNGKMITGLGSTMVRLGLGLLFGMIPGIILGLAMGWSSRLRSIVDPFIAAVHPIPKTAIYPLIMIILGIGESSKVFTIALATFFPVLINSMLGVRQLNPVYFDVAKNYGANPWKVFSRIILPGSLPMVIAGIRIAFNNALVVTIAVELIVARQGLGVMIWYAWETLRTTELYAVLTVIALIGILINFVLVRASKYLSPWHEQSIQEKA